MVERNLLKKFGNGKKNIIKELKINLKNWVVLMIGQEKNSL